MCLSLTSEAAVQEGTSEITQDTFLVPIPPILDVSGLQQYSSYSYCF